MPNFNLIVIAGHIGNEPEMRFTPNGIPVTNFSLATNKSFTNNAGEKKTTTEWFNVVTWRKLAEHCNQYLSKGVPVLVSGEFHRQEWEDDNKNIKSRSQINATSVVFLSSGEKHKPYDIPDFVDDMQSGNDGESTESKHDLPF